MEEIVRTVCQACHSECGVLAHVEKGKVTRISPDPDHPSSRGFICVKGINYHHFVHHPDRLKYPLKRVGGKGGGKWERISWDEALNQIAAGLTAVKERSNNNSIGTFHGTGPRAGTTASHLLASALGTPNRCNTDLHICLAPSLIAQFATFGHSVMLETGPDYLSSKCILVCGANPVTAHPPRGRDLLEGVKKNGAKLIVIDPRRTKLADQADIWLQIRPGTAAALILAILHTIISEEIYDKSFVENYCHGFDKLKEHISSYSPEKVAHLTWVSAAETRKAARLFAQTGPAAIHNRNGVEEDLSSVQTVRGLAILAGITGNLAIKGGNIFSTPLPGYYSAFGMMHFGELPPEKARERIGYDEYPLAAGPESPFPFVHPALAAKAMLQGKPYPLKALVLMAGNPVINMQNAKRTWDAFKNLDLLVVADFFMTPTAELADYVLPAATWIENDECCDVQYMNCIAARQKAIEPLYECQNDYQIAIDLVKRLPWADRKYLPWKDVEAMNDFRVKGLGMTFNEFKKKGYVPVPIQYKQYEQGGFRTPTGKMEIYSTLFERYGYTPLPVYTEPRESPNSTPELMKQYPYILTTGSRSIKYMQSEGRQVSQLRKLLPDPEVEMHPDAAKKTGFEEGDWVWLETPQIKGERIRLKVKFTVSVDPRVVHVRNGWWFPEKPAPEHGCFESNINVVLDDDHPRELICGSVPCRATLCRIYRQPGV